MPTAKQNEILPSLWSFNPLSSILYWETVSSQNLPGIIVMQWPFAINDAMIQRLVDIGIINLDYIVSQCIV